MERKPVQMLQKIWLGVFMRECVYVWEGLKGVQGELGSKEGEGDEGKEEERKRRKEGSDPWG